MSNWTRLVHRVNRRLLQIHLIVWILITLLLARGAFAYESKHEQPEPMSWLVVVYLPISGDPVPYVKFYYIEKKLCNGQAKQIYNNVKAGKVRAFCF